MKRSAALQRLLDCCACVLRGDSEYLLQLREHGFSCGVAQWQFSLPALHGYLQDQLQSECPDYRTFLRELYSSDLNTCLRQQGAEIAIVDNLGKVDSNLYCLRARR